MARRNIAFPLSTENTQISEHTEEQLAQELGETLLRLVRKAVSRVVLLCGPTARAGLPPCHATVGEGNTSRAEDSVHAKRSRDGDVDFRLDAPGANCARRDPCD